MEPEATAEPAGLSQDFIDALPEAADPAASMEGAGCVPVEPPTADRDVAPEDRLALQAAYDSYHETAGPICIEYGESLEGGGTKTRYLFVGAHRGVLGEVVRDAGGAKISATARPTLWLTQGFHTYEGEVPITAINYSQDSPRDNRDTRLFLLMDRHALGLTPY